MAVAANVIFIWSGTNATIPTGWVRETSLDSKYVLGPSIGTDGGGTGGSATHSHTGGSHTHSFVSGTYTGSTWLALGGRGAGFAATDHTHPSATSNASNLTIGNTSNDPPYYEIIFCKSSGTNDVGDDMIGFWDDDADKGTSWVFCDGGSSTPDLRNKFLKGVTTSGDSGGTGGSSDSHLHTTAHSHTAKASGVATTDTPSAISGGSGAAGKSHTHSVSLTSGGGNSNTADGQPPFKKLIPYQNQTGGEDFPDKIIGMWIGTHAGIPTNWARYTAMDDQFQKCPNIVGDALGTGGTDQHSHTTVTHNHPSSAGFGATSLTENTGFLTVPRANHGHVWTIGNATPSIPNNTSKDNYPDYVDGIFIKYTAPQLAQVISVQMI